MEKGYIENGFIVDLSNSKKTSEMIYELSKILDIPEARGKKVCLKLGANVLNSSQLISIKALIESMDSVLECISSTCPATVDDAKSLNITVSEWENKMQPPEFEEPQVSEEVENALDKIFGDENFDEENPEVDEVTSEENNEFMDRLDNDVDPEELAQGRKETANLPTLYIQNTVRSGQSISSDGNIFILGDVNPGAEVIAKGDVTVWGVLGGIAQAGCEGNAFARIRALKMNAIQLRIADVFARRPDSANIPYVQKSNEFTPEEARVSKKHIIIYKLIEN